MLRREFYINSVVLPFSQYSTFLLQCLFIFWLLSNKNCNIFLCFTTPNPHHQLGQPCQSWTTWRLNVHTDWTLVHQSFHVWLLFFTGIKWDLCCVHQDPTTSQNQSKTRLYHWPWRPMWATSHFGLITPLKCSVNELVRNCGENSLHSSMNSPTVKLSTVQRLITSFQVKDGDNSLRKVTAVPEQARHLPVIQGPESGSAEHGLPQVHPNWSQVSRPCRQNIWGWYHYFCVSLQLELCWTHDEETAFSVHQKKKPSPWWWNLVDRRQNKGAFHRLGRETINPGLGLWGGCLSTTTMTRTTMTTTMARTTTRTAMMAMTQKGLYAGYIPDSPFLIKGHMSSKTSQRSSSCLKGGQTWHQCDSMTHCHVIPHRFQPKVLKLMLHTVHD